MSFLSRHFQKASAYSYASYVYFESSRAPLFWSLISRWLSPMMLDDDMPIFHGDITLHGVGGTALLRHAFSSWWIIFIFDAVFRHGTITMLSCAAYASRSISRGLAADLACRVLVTHMKCNTARHLCDSSATWIIIEEVIDDDFYDITLRMTADVFFSRIFMMLDYIVFPA